MSCQDFSNYWTSTEVYDALKNYIDMDFDGLREDIVKMLGGVHVKVDTRSFRNDMYNLETKDDVLTLLIHLGYLAYDAKTKEAFIPNKEIIEEFETAIRQIKDRKYMQVLEGYTGEVILVGINYDKTNKNKPHSCVIEKISWKV